MHLQCSSTRLVYASAGFAHVTSLGAVSTGCFALLCRAFLGCLTWPQAAYSSDTACLLTSSCVALLCVLSYQMCYMCIVPLPRVNTGDWGQSAPGLSHLMCSAFLGCNLAQGSLLERHFMLAHLLLVLPCCVCCHANCVMCVAASGHGLWSWPLLAAAVSAPHTPAAATHELPRAGDSGAGEGTASCTQPSCVMSSLSTGSGIAFAV